MELIDVQIALGIMFAVIALVVVWIGYLMTKLLDMPDMNKDRW